MPVRVLVPIRVTEADGQGQMREEPVGVARLPSVGQGFPPKRVSALGRRVNGGCPCRPRDGNSSTIIKISWLDKENGMWYNLSRFLDGKKEVRN